MSAEQRVSVKTSVPEYQKREWTEHADALDMSQSEFVRTMVQAGRRGFDPEPPEGGSPDANPRGNVLRTPVLDALDAAEPRDFEEVVETVGDRLDELVESTLESLAESGVVEFSPRGGILLAGGARGGD